MPPGPSQGGVAAIGVSVTLTVVATGFVALRFWSRSITKFGLWIDDWLALATLVTLYWVLIISIMAVQTGGLEEPILEALLEDESSVLQLLKLLYTFEWAYLCASPLMKVTVLAYYWRIFPGKNMRWGIRILSGMCIIWFICVLVGNAVQCEPISKFWDINGVGFCRFEASLYAVVVAAPNSVIDLLTVLLPIYEVWHLQLSLMKRIGVSAIFGIGGIVVVASIVRLALLVEFRNKGPTGLTQDLLIPWFSTVVEISTAIIGACSPCLMPLYRKIRYGSALSGSPGYRYNSSQKSNHGHNLSNLRPTHAGRSSHKVLSSSDQDGPFERIDSKQSPRGLEDFGSVSPQLYTAEASGGRASRDDPKSIDDDMEIPLQGISVVHEVTVKGSSKPWP